MNESEQKNKGMQNMMHSKGMTVQACCKISTKHEVMIIWQDCKDADKL